MIGYVFGTRGRIGPLAYASSMIACTVGIGVILMEALTGLFNNRLEMIDLYLYGGGFVLCVWASFVLRVMRLRDLGASRREMAMAFAPVYGTIAEYSLLFKAGPPRFEPPEEVRADALEAALEREIAARAGRSPIVSKEGWGKPAGWNEPPGPRRGPSTFGRR